MKFLTSAIFLSVAAAASCVCATIIPERGLNMVMDRSSNTTNTCGNLTNAVPFYRLYRPAQFYYLYLTSVAEFPTTFTLQGVAALVFNTQEESTVPFYRLVNAGQTRDLYTISTTERDDALQNGWFAAVQTFYIYPTQVCGSVPFYRLYQATEMANFYTISESERLDFIANQGYTDVEIAGYVLPLMSSQCT